MINLDPKIPLSFIYGSHSCMDHLHKTGYEVYHLRTASRVQVYMVQDAGYDILADNPGGLCEVISVVLEEETEKASVANISDELY